VLPDEDLEVKLSNFYTKIKEPVLANVKVDFSGAHDVKVSQLYPNRMPDLFKGTCWCSSAATAAAARARCGSAAR